MVVVHLVSRSLSVLETFNYEINTIGLTRAGASLNGQLVIVKDQSVLETFNNEANTIGLTRAGASLTSQGTGNNYQDWDVKPWVLEHPCYHHNILILIFTYYNTHYHTYMTTLTMLNMNCLIE